MTEDMLMGYAQAQLMIGGFMATAPAVIQRQATRVGEDAYVNAVFVLNILIILAVLAECLQTCGWKELVLFDYMEVEWLTVGGFKGGVLAAKGDDNEVELLHGTSPNEWRQLDVTLKSFSGDSFVHITKRVKGLL